MNMIKDTVILFFFFFVYLSCPFILHGIYWPLEFLESEASISTSPNLLSSCKYVTGKCESQNFIPISYFCFASLIANNWSQVYLKKKWEKRAKCIVCTLKYVVFFVYIIICMSYII